MTSHPGTRDPRPGVDAAAVVVVVASIVIAGVGLVFRPALLTPIAVALALIASGMSVRRRSFAAAAAVIAGLAWFVGMTIALFTDTPLF